MYKKKIVTNIYKIAFPLNPILFYQSFFVPVRLYLKPILFPTIQLQLDISLRNDFKSEYL